MHANDLLDETGKTSETLWIIGYMKIKKNNLLHRINIFKKLTVFYFMNGQMKTITCNNINPYILNMFAIWYRESNQLTN